MSMDPNADAAPGDAQASYPPPQAAAGNGRPFTIASFVCAVAALIVFPILLGPIGIVLGILGHRRGDGLGRTAAITAGVCMVVGMVVGALLASNNDEALALLLP